MEAATGRERYHRVLLVLALVVALPPGRGSVFLDFACDLTCSQVRSIIAPIKCSWEARGLLTRASLRRLAIGAQVVNSCQPAPHQYRR
jgi:hypothetical protein